MRSETIPLQDSVVYGPIHSRRLGHSLGINVLPLSHKVCSSNCVYCQYGWTLPEGTAERLRRAPELLQDIDAAFADHVDRGTPVDCVTLAGNGEPTLHPDLLELVVGIKMLRDRHFPGARVGILTDSTQLTRPRVRETLGLLDVRYMKFDAADEATWRRINDPLGKTDFQAMVEALRRLPEIILQSMFIQGSHDNTDAPHLQRWIQVVGSIRPLSVQVYTVDRGTAASGIVKVPRATLQQIANRLTTATGIPADVYD
ncbi:MAG: radical SAM protein [Candidatus Omnitrophota bacterium]|nr:radical SAM protein [Candidatus Omnitrophota bacterium]